MPANEDNHHSYDGNGKFMAGTQSANGMLWYSSIYIAPLNNRGLTDALLVRLAPRKETSFKK